MVRTHLGQRFDDAALIGAIQGNTQVRLSDGFFVARTSAGAFIVAMIAVLAVAWCRRRLRLGVALVVTAVLAVLVTHALKVDVLTRPDLLPSEFVIRKNSFPSGHTATAVAAAFVLVVVSPPSVRGGVAVLAGIYACVIASDVQTAGWHRPSDAIGACFVAFSLVAVTAAAVARRRQIGAGRRNTHPVAYGVLAIAWVVSAAVSVADAAHALATLRGSTDPRLATLSVRNDAHDFSIAMTVLVVATLLAALLALLGEADLDEPYSRDQEMLSTRAE
jgi:membrane-associated phospholipid phosphatase